MPSSENPLPLLGCQTDWSHFNTSALYPHRQFLGPYQVLLELNTPS